MTECERKVGTKGVYQLKSEQGVARAPLADANRDTHGQVGGGCPQEPAQFGATERERLLSEHIAEQRWRRASWDSCSKRPTRASPKY